MKKENTIKILTPFLSKIQYKIKIKNENKRHPFPTTLSRMCYTNSSSSSSPGPTVWTLVHPMSIPVGLTDTLIICLAAALASIDLMKGTIQQNNKRNTTTTMQIIMPNLVNHCPQDPKSELSQSQACMSAPAFLVTSSLRFFQFPHCFGEWSIWGCIVWNMTTKIMMAPHMAASVCCSLVLFLFLFVCPVLSNYNSSPAQTRTF